MVSAEVVQPGEGSAPDRILAIVVEILESEGYDAVQLREVAKRARSSLATIYKRYGTRDELILTALDHWMAEHRYSGLVDQKLSADGSLYDKLMRVLRTIFEPWESHPGMLTAYVRARSGPGGDKLVRRGFDIVVPAAMEAFVGVDPQFVHDVDNIVFSLVYGLAGRFAAGEIPIADILSSVDRTVYWLTVGYEASRSG